MREIYFIRHQSPWSSIAEVTESASAQEYLIENHYIAIHFDGIESWEQAEYSRAGKTAIRYMNKLNECPNNESAPYIFAAYLVGGRNRIFVGQPDIGTKKFLSEVLEKPAPPLKLLKLRSWREISIGDFPRAFMLPPKFTTFVRWNQCEEQANHYFDGTEPDILNYKSYMPDALETVCGEYLRRNGLEALINKSGGQLKDFDIIGISKGNQHIYAQVKARRDSRSSARFADLAKADPKSRYIFFSGNATEGSTAPNLEWISMETVLSFILNEEPLGNSYLRLLVTR